MRAVLLALAVACSAPDAAPASSDAPTAQMWVENKTDRAGTLVLQVVADQGAELSLPTPEAPGLALEPEGTTTEALGGGRSAITARWRFSGSAGSYEVHAVDVGWTEDTDSGVAHANSVFVDLDTAPPRDGELEDIVAPEPVGEPTDWRPIAVVAALAALIGAGLFVAFRPRRRAAGVVAEPPDVLALRAWAAVRADARLDDFAKALALSRIFREYAEAVLGFPATAWTTTEVLDRLSGLQHLPEGNVPRARNLLRATDRIKFADATARADLFEDLDADLRAFVDSTRPRRMGDS